MSSYLKTGIIVGGTAVVGGVTAVVAAPVVVSAIGFGAGGIIAGSWAASMMSTLAPVGAGGLVATLQSVGAAGLGVTGSGVLHVYYWCRSGYWCWCSGKPIAVKVNSPYDIL